MNIQRWEENTNANNTDAKKANLKHEMAKNESVKTNTRDHRVAVMAKGVHVALQLLLEDQGDSLVDLYCRKRASLFYDEVFEDGCRGVVVARDRKAAVVPVAIAHSSDEAP